MNFSELVTSSVLMRALAIIILGTTVIMALIIAAVEILRGETVNPTIWTIAGAGLGMALSVLNINYGVLLQPAPPAQPAQKGTATSDITTTPSP